MIVIEGDHDRGDVLDATGVPSGDVLARSALGGFRLRFTNGGHQLRRVGVHMEVPAVRFALEDRGGEDGRAPWSGGK